MKIVNCKLKIAKRKGFTLIEMIVVVFVLGIGLIGALSFFNINLNNQFEAKNELIAAGLAQEGADLVRNMVDFRKLKNDNWTTSIVPYIKSCDRIDYGSLSGSHNCNTGNDYVCLSSGSGRYQQCSSGTGTEMKRTLKITDGPGNSLQIICDVEWNGRKTTAKDILYNNSY